MTAALIIIAVIGGYIRCAHALDEIFDSVDRDDASRRDGLFTHAKDYTDV